MRMRVLNETLLGIFLSKGIEAFKIIPIDPETLTLQSQTYSTFEDDDDDIFRVVISFVVYCYCSFFYLNVMGYEGG